MSLTDDELDRYARHIVLHDIGGTGQMAIRAARMLVIGAGGIGSPVIQYLAAAGVGAITIVDDDLVSLSNLQRQVLYATDDIGKPKADVAAQRAMAINPHVAASAVRLRVSSDTVAELLQDVDVVIDGSDNFATRLAVADAAHHAHIPLVSAAIGQFHGQLGTFRGWEETMPCYRCFVGNPEDQPERNCAAVGVLGALTGVIGSLMAMEAIRELSAFSPSSAGRITLFDATACRFRSISLPKDPACPSCVAQ